jgi:hypothetical protein
MVVNTMVKTKKVLVDRAKYARVGGGIWLTVCTSILVAYLSFSRCFTVIGPKFSLDLEVRVYNL